MSLNNNSLTIPLVIGGTAVLFRLHFYRHLRKIILPIGIFSLFLRLKYLSKNEIESILVILTKFIQQQNPKISILFGDILGLYLLITIGKTISNIWSYDPASLYNLITEKGFNFIKTFPFVKALIDKERESVDKLVEEEMKSKIRAMGEQYLTLPQNGKSSEEIISFLQSLVKKEDLVWENGRVSGSVYHGNREHQKLLNDAFGLYSLANPLHPDMWPSSTKLEAEIISMTANLMTTKLKTLCG